MTQENPESARNEREMVKRIYALDTLSFQNIPLRDLIFHAAIHQFYFLLGTSTGTPNFGTGPLSQQISTNIKCAVLSLKCLLIFVGTGHTIFWHRISVNLIAI
jgi:hypothetical protein